MKILIFEINLFWVIKGENKVMDYEEREGMNLYVGREIVSRLYKTKKSCHEIVT